MHSLSPLRHTVNNHPHLALFCLYSLLFLPLYIRLILGFDVYAAGDSFGFNAPALRALEPFSLSSLLADPYTGRGFPWLVTYGTFDPVAHFLRLFLDEFQTLGALCFVSFVMGAWLCALWLRQTYSLLASFVGGFLFAGAFFWTGDGDYPLALSVPIFAGVLLILSRMQRRPLTSTILLSLLLAYGWLAGHFNFVPLIVIGGGLYAVWLGRKGRGLWQRLRPAIFYGIASIAGTGIGLLKLIPALAYVQLSERAGGLSAAAASTTTLRPGYMLTALFPYARIPFTGTDVGGLFIGAGGVALLLMGVLSAHKHRRPLTVIVLCLLIAVPGSPLFTLLQQVPFLSFLRAPTRWLFLAYPAMALLSASVIDELREGRLERPRRIIGLLFRWLVGIFAVLIVALTAINLIAREAVLSGVRNFFDTHLYAKTSGLPLEHYHRHIARLWDDVVGSFSLMEPGFFWPFLCLILIAFILSQYHRWWSRQVAVWVLGGCTVFSLLVPLFFYHAKAPRSTIDDVRSFYSSTPIGDAPVMTVMPGLTQFLQHGAVPGLSDQDAFRHDLALLMPNAHALLGVRSIDFYQPLQPLRMSRPLALLGNDNAPSPMIERLALSKIPFDEKLQIFLSRLPLLQILGIKYLVSGWEVPSLKEVAALRPVATLPPVRVYEVPGPRPLVYEPGKVELMTPDQDAAIARLSSLQDPSLSIIECALCPVSSSEADALKIISEEHTPLSSSITVVAVEPSWLIIQRPRIPGWRVFVDDQPVRTAIGNGLFFAVPVGSGRSQVDVRLSYATLLADSWYLLRRGEDRWLM